MRFVQLAVTSNTEDGEALYALGEDGFVYERTSIHYGPGGSYDGHSITRGHTYTSPFWRKVELPFTEPPLDNNSLRRLEFQEEA